MVDTENIDSLVNRGFGDTKLVPEGDEDTDIVDRVKTALEMTDGIEIARRYLVMNAFDGALTMLGLIFGGLTVMNTIGSELIFNAVILAGVGSSVAMAISGFSGCYLTESAERQRDVYEFRQSKIPRRVSPLEYHNASRMTTIVVALIDGLAPAVAAFIIMLPLFIATLGILDYWSATMLAVMICMTELFILGTFLGKVSRGSKLIYGAKTLATGIGTATIMLIIALLTGARP